jgi:hypothetical protein
MNPSSLPQYPDRPCPAALPGNNSAELMSSRRLTALGMRAVFLVGIWGGLFAFRSLLLSREAEAPRPQGPLDSLVGTWEATDDSGFAVEFTKEQNIRFLWHGKVFYTGLWRRHREDAGVEIPDLIDEEGNKLPDKAKDRQSLFPGPDLEFTVAVRGDDLSVANVLFRVAPVGVPRPLFSLRQQGNLNLKRKR